MGTPTTNLQIHIAVWEIKESDHNTVVIMMWLNMQLASKTYM